MQLGLDDLFGLDHHHAVQLETFDHTHRHDREIEGETRASGTTELHTTTSQLVLDFTAA